MKQSIKKGLIAGASTTWSLGKVIFPVTLLVTILQFTPALDWAVTFVAPLMGWIGLSGEAAIPLLVGQFLNLYAAIGAIISLSLSVKEVFILAVMLSFSHNLLIESAVASKVGIKIWVVLVVRIGLALISAFVINLAWSGGSQQAKPLGGVDVLHTEAVNGWWDIILMALQAAFMGVVQLALIVIPLMIGIQLLKDYGWVHRFSKWMAPVTKALGMSPNTSTTLASGLVFGLAFGSAVMIQAAKEDGVSKKDLYLAFIFLVACHAVIEDTLIFIPLGIPVWPLLLIRLLTAIVLTMVVAFVWNRTTPAPKRKEMSYEH
ncbi:nucleoside recognition domain-containing protein [Aureibacillus halotolerans]|uniref:Nucleoside recognition protein n=1 Tax=Aureibacillus halotolerans TaxID=1508390 RepID=A0A4R6U1K6_9BACI|nr:nucleoside recognition domain-containing protein [Aureibacillus halotolerans]TDQ36964.1 nucleoside recognition protein [Aureibacillus halotolerans]